MNAMKRIPYLHNTQHNGIKSRATYHRYPKHRRQLRRLCGYDYSRAGAYFVTTCTHGRTNLFGKIVKHEMRLNVYGRMVQEVWNGLPGHYPHVALDAFVIMPNHIHGIVVLATPVGAGFKPAPTPKSASTPRHGLPEIVRAFKTFSARQIIACVIPLVPPCGNAIIMNTSSATRPP